MAPDDDRDQRDERNEERRGIRLNEHTLYMLSVIAARRFPGERRKQSETIRRLILEEYERMMASEASEQQRMPTSTE